jgi:putative membrane protein
MPEAHSDSSFDPRKITRPDPVLMTYYVLLSLLSTVAFPLPLIVLWCKYHTLRYRFDDKGVSMSWGVLFRRETYLTYRRIQDIHVTRNIVQRWLGLATISLQTASGTSGAEMSIEGILEAEALRDYLYAQMRGAKGEVPAESAARDVGQPGDEVLSVLCEIRDELQRLAKQREAGA